MKLYLVQWHYHDDTMTCAIMDDLEKAKEAKAKIEEGLKTNFFQGTGFGFGIEIDIEERELNSIKCDEAKLYLSE